MTERPRRIVSLRRVAARVARGIMAGAIASGGPLAAACRLHTEQPPVAAEARAPDFGLPAHDGRTVTLEELLARGPAVLVFYRGHW